MLTVDVITQSGLDPAAAHAIDVALVASVAERRRAAALHVFALAERVVALGRYHLAPTARAGSTVRLHRRLGGGRVAPLGAGFAAISLVLPHRSALAAQDPQALRPEQALNRCTRGLLAALRGLGVDAFYPGRDVLTVDRRLLGVVSLQSEHGTTAVFEALVAVDGDWSALAEWIETVDGDCVIAAERLRSEQVTALARHVTRSPSLDELAHALGGAYACEFGVEPVASSLSPAESAPGTADEWLGESRRRPSLNRHALAWGQLGAFEAHLACDDAGAIADIMLTGDFIADAPSLAGLEVRLRGCPLRAEAILAIVRSVYSAPDSFLFGLGALELVADTIARAR